MENHNFNILLFNVALYVITLIIYQKRRKKWGVGSFILLLYIIVAVVGMDLFFHPLSTYEDIKIFPFIYLYVMLMIGVYPILKINDSEITNLQEPTPFLINKISWAVVIITIISTIPYLFNFQETIGNIFKSGGSFVQTMYSDSRDTVDSRGDGSFNPIGILASMVVNLCPLLFFYFISRENVNKLLSFGLGVATLFSLFPSLAQSARGALVKTLFSIGFLFLFFNNTLSESKRKVVRKVMIVLLFTLAVPFVVITVGRFGEKERGEDLTGFFVEYYLGQSFLFFNNYGIDPGAYRYGDRTATLFKQVLGFETANNYNKRLDKHFDMNIDESLFSTYVGEFTLDYGVYATAAIFIFFSFFFRKRLKIDATCTFSQLLLYYLLFNICVGIFLFPYADLGGNMEIIMYIALYILFKYNHKQQLKTII